MSIKISDFKHQISNLARGNRFLVMFDVSSDISINNSLLRSIPFHAQTAKIPERNIGDIPIPFHGMQLHIPGDYSHDDLQISFLNQQTWELRDFLESWSESLHSVSAANNFHGFSKELLEGATIRVTQLGNAGEYIVTYVYHNVFPKLIGEIALDMTNYDAVETYDTTWAYSHYEKLKPTTINIGISSASNYNLGN